METDQVLICVHCGVRCINAWDFLDHISSRHGLRLFQTCNNALNRMQTTQNSAQTTSQCNPSSADSNGMMFYNNNNSFIMSQASLVNQVLSILHNPSIRLI